MKKTFTLVGVLTVLAGIIYFGYRYLTRNVSDGASDESND